jgi:peptide/nickel transport system permease protein
VIAPEQTYWDIVKGQFRKNRTAVAALYLTIGLFALAIVAPLLATSSPFYLKTKDGTEFPWFRDLFDQNRFQGGVDLFFNLLLVATPFVLLAVRFLPTKRVLQVSGVVILYVFFCMAGPKDWLEGDVGRIAFYPQHVLRYSYDKRDYLDLQETRLGRILAEQKIDVFERRLGQSRAALAALAAEPLPTLEELTDDARANAEAKKVAAEDQVKSAERELAAWRVKLKELEERAADPAFAYTAVMPPIGYHHDDNDEERIVERPTWSGWGAGHFLGTDRNGRDVLARIIYGTRVSLTIGVIAVAIYCTIGTILGALAGYFGGWVDILIMRLVEIMICFPVFAFILIVVAVTGSKNIFLIMVVIGIVRWTGVTRLIRGQFLTERSLDYVVAAQALGIPARRIVFKHVLPNAIHPMFVAATFGVAAAILLESGLAFLGLGDPTVPSWGQLLLEGRQTGKLWLILSPGVAIFITVTLLNLVGEGLRDALDPKLRQ